MDHSFVYSLDDLWSERASSLEMPMTAPPQAAAALISFAYGLADPALFPRDDLLSATADVLRDDAPAALNYGPTSRTLREQVASRLRAEGVEAEIDQVLISYGSSQILGLLPQLLVNHGDTVLIEGPSFMGAVRNFSSGGAQLVTVPVDEHGMDVDALEAELEALRRRNIRPKFVYTIPTFHNPTGATLTLERRQKLVELAARYGVLVVEDDAYHELRFEGQPVPSLAALDAEGWVLRIGTFSKILAPGLRQGWAYARPEVIRRLEQLKIEGSSGPFLTRLVANYSADGRLDRHIQRLNAHYRHKRDVMLEAIGRSFPADVAVVRPEGGFFLWCTLPEGMSATELLPLAEQQGATFLPGTRCFANGQGDNAIRLAFSYVPTEQIADGIERIGVAMAVLQGRQ